MTFHKMAMNSIMQLSKFNHQVTPTIKYYLNGNHSIISSPYHRINQNPIYKSQLQPGVTVNSRTVYYRNYTNQSNSYQPFNSFQDVINAYKKQSLPIKIAFNHYMDKTIHGDTLNTTTTPLTLNLSAKKPELLDTDSLISNHDIADINSLEPFTICKNNDDEVLEFYKNNSTINIE